MISYQLISRIFDLSEIMSAVTPAWWHYLMPTAWFALRSVFSLRYVSVYYLVLSIIALAVPAVSLVLYIRLVAPNFEKYLRR